MGTINGSLRFCGMAIEAVQFIKTLDTPANLFIERNIYSTFGLILGHFYMRYIYAGKDKTSRTCF